MDILKKKSKELSTPDKPDERPSSPYDCAICLEQLTDKSFTNSCLHTFCFHCLLAWSKVKPECPLCKQDFCSIFHNIRSIDDFDEYHVPTSEARLQMTPPIINGNNRAEDFIAPGHDFFSNHRRFFAYRTTAMSSGFSIPRERSPNLVIQPYVDNLEFQNDFSRVNYSHPLHSRSNRREIYLKELETLPPPTGGRYRECSPEFYRENEGQLHRLARWLHRELIALSQIGVRFVHHELQHLIMDLLRIYNINSDIFHNIVNRYLGAHTSRFIREFYNFATSPYEMDQYDRECVYVRQRTGSHLSFIVTVGRDDTEDVQVIPSTSLDQPVRPWIDVNDLNTTHYHVTGSGIQISARLHRNAFQRINRLSTSSNPAVSSHSVINISDSENDDCVIIDEVRTTPETIVLDDSDRESQSRLRTTPNRPPRRCSKSPEHNSVPLDLSTARSPSSSVSVIDVHDVPSTSRQPPNVIFTSTPCPSESKKHLSKKEEKHTEIKSGKIKYRRRSSSATSSVLSTDLSSDEIDQDKSSILKNKRKKAKKYSKTKNPRRSGTSRHRKKSSGTDFAIFSSDSSSVESDKNDLDWEVTRYKKKRKIKKVFVDKHEKKSNLKKRKKSTSEHRSQKKKKVSISISDSCDSVDNDVKYEKKTKNYKKKLGLSSSSNHYVKFHRAECESSEQPQRSCAPKLRSIVKKVNNRVDVLNNVLNRHSNYYNAKNSSEYDNINDIPSTSYGFNGYRESRSHSINFSNNTYSSDSSCKKTQG